MIFNLKVLDLTLANKVVDRMLDEESKQILAINGQNGFSVSVAQQFVDYFEGKYLKYNDDDEICRRFLEIYEYSRFSLLDWKNAKLAKEALLKPENYYQINQRGITADIQGGNLNLADTTNIIEKKQLNLERGDTSNLTDAKLTNRAANSQFNDDDASIEEQWKQLDSKDNKPKSTKKQMLDIKVPADLQKASVEDIMSTVDVSNFFQAPQVPLEPRPEEEIDDTDSSIAYTGVGVAKNFSYTSVDGATTAKGFNALYDKNTNEAVTIQTNTGKTTTISINKNFIHADAVMKTLSRSDIKNFRQKFFNSFQPLFHQFWDGY